LSLTDGSPRSVEVVITTYNSPSVLDLVLSALTCQTAQCFGVCVADDGSDERTQALIQDWQSRASAFGGQTLRHVWQPDEGFQKNRILNKAIASSPAEYLVFIDGDCLASPRFVERHLSLAKPGRFVSGGLIRLPLSATPHIKTGNILSGEVFQPLWLRHQGALDSVGDWLKSAALPTGVLDALEWLTPVKRTWNGCNASGWKADLLAVNGFNESMRYGAEDVELGVRLNHLGIKARHCRYSAPLLHIEHSRGYADPGTIAANQAHVKALRRTSVSWTDNGIQPSPRDQ